MTYRTVVMYVEISCFVVCVSGWILVSSTLPTDIWTWPEGESTVLLTSTYYSNLWKDCIADSTGVSDCKGIPSLLALNWDIHMCRALIIIAIILAFFGSILVLVGMKCTKIGGSELANARVTFAAGINYLTGGMSSMVAFSYFGNKIRAEFHDPDFVAMKSEIGVGVFIGWGGSTLLIVGGLILSVFVGREGCRSSTEKHTTIKFHDAFTLVPTERSLLSLTRREISGSRTSKSTGDSKDGSISRITGSTRTSATNV